MAENSDSPNTGEKANGSGTCGPVAEMVDPTEIAGSIQVSASVRNNSDIEPLGSVGTPNEPISKEPMGPVRQRIVYILLAILGGLILLPFLMAICCKDCMTKELWEFVHIVFPALTGLLGTAIGFYFERNSR